MMTFFIKSTICLVMFYGFYHFFLRQQKILIFNRFYLNSAVGFSMILPLISIPVESSKLPVNYSFDNLTFTVLKSIQGETIIKQSPQLINFQVLFIIIFILITSVLFLRFTLNLTRIIKRIIKSKKIVFQKTSIVLVEEETLPYSFFRYIFLNKSDYENGRIEKELLIHEASHCHQNHSLDIMIMELINIFFWFNPLIWLFKKAILLNHEFYADNTVLKDRDLIYYQNILLYKILKGNYVFLVSNFKDSFIKNRLAMMTRSKPIHSALLRKISAVLLFLVMAISLGVSQESKAKSETKNNQNQWWLPIIKKHNVDLKQFPFKNSFSDVSGDSTINNAFAIGKNPVTISKPGVETPVITIEEPILILQIEKSGYQLLIAKSATQDSGNDQITFENGTMETFIYGDEWMESPEFASYIKPGKSLSFKKLTLNTRTKKILIENLSGTSNLK